jgi:hypothetical protein
MTRLLLFLFLPAITCWALALLAFISDRLHRHKA